MGTFRCLLLLTLGGVAAVAERSKPLESPPTAVGHGLTAAHLNQVGLQLPSSILTIVDLAANQAGLATHQTIKIQ
jgi:hypothetical protein